MHTAVLLEDGWKVIDVPGATNRAGTNANFKDRSHCHTRARMVSRIWRARENRYSHVNDPCPAEYTYGVADGINDGQVTSYVVDSSGVALACVGRL